MGLHFQDGLAWDAKAKQWRIRVQIGKKPRKGSAPNKEAAERFRDALRLERTARRLGVPLPKIAPLPPSLAQAFARYAAELRQYRKSPRSIAQVESVADLWKRALGPAQPASLTREDFGRFVEWAGLHTRSQGAQTRAAVTIAKTAMRIVGLPTPETPKVKVPRRSRPTSTATSVRAFLAALEPGSVARVAAELVLRTACREVEARELTIGDVDLDAGQIVFGRRKGAQPGRENAPISSGLRAHLGPWLAGPCRGVASSEPLLAVWSRRAGQPKARHALTPWTLQKALGAAGEAAGLGRTVRGLGWLRNQALTLAGETGATVEVLRRAAGHTSSAVTERHYDQSRRWAAREALAEAVGSVLDAPAVPGISGQGRGESRVQPGTTGDPREGEGAAPESRTYASGDEGG